MVRRLLSLAALSLITFGVLVGCNQLATTMIIGSVNTDTEIEGGTPFHVLVLAAGTTLDPTTDGEVDSVPTVARYDGTFPGGVGDWSYTANYQITDVPAGLYYVFTWIDMNDDGSFTSASDACVFYDGAYNPSAQPDVANVLVPEAGIVDVDLVIGFAA